MKQTSTQELLMRHLYGETTAAEKQQIARELALDADLQEELQELLEAKIMLDEKLKSPSDTSLRIILDHSCRTGHLQAS